MSLEFLLAVAVNLVGLGAVYGGIRAQIHSLAEGLKEAKDRADNAHARIDVYFDRRSEPR
jgi:hypothetical protein